jgi:hypothetical protein
MADIHDMHGAIRETDHAIGNTQAASGKLEDGAGEGMIGVAVANGLEAVALAIRELGVRMDYVLRDEMRRQARG